MPDKSKSGHEKEKDPNAVNGDHKDDPPSDSDKCNPRADGIFEEADAETAKKMSF